MPERIETANIVGVDDQIEINDEYPGTYGFRVKLSRDPGPEWGVEFDSAYEVARYPGKPPVEFHGDSLSVFYLARYADDLPNFLRFLQRTIVQTNKAVEQRNAVLPDEEAQKQTFRQRLRDTAKLFVS